MPSKHLYLYTELRALNRWIYLRIKHIDATTWVEYIYTGPPDLDVFSIYGVVYTSRRTHSRLHYAQNVYIRNVSIYVYSTWVSNPETSPYL